MLTQSLLSLSFSFLFPVHLCRNEKKEQDGKRLTKTTAGRGQRQGGGQGRGRQERWGGRQGGGGDKEAEERDGGGTTWATRARSKEEQHVTQIK